VSGQYRTLRGGSWNDYPRLLRVSGRYRLVPNDRGSLIGLRCVGEQLGPAALPALAEAQQVVKCRGTLSEAQLTELVKGSIPAVRIGQLVASCGIDFEPTGEAISRLRSAGKPETVLGAVRTAVSAPPKLSAQNLDDIGKRADAAFSRHDYATAVSLYRQLAASGHTGAMNRLGFMYDSGAGVAEDPTQAVAWYRKAAENGDPNSMNNLAWMYQAGRGVVTDMAEAIAWYRRAAALGNWEAKVNLKQLGQ